MKTTTLQLAAAQSAGAAAKSECWLALAARTARKRLYVRPPNLPDYLPALVETYRKTHQLVDAGHVPKPTA